MGKLAIHYPLQSPAADGPLHVQTAAFFHFLWVTRRAESVRTVYGRKRASNVGGARVQTKEASGGR